MVIVLSKKIKEEDKKHLKKFLLNRGFKVREIVGEEETIIGAVGVAPIDIREVELLPGVQRVIPISSPYKLASRELQKEDTIVSIGKVKIGGLRIAVIAGPCAVESREQIFESARLIRESGGIMLRGGAYKPRTSPYAFQGLGEEGLKLIKEAGEKEGLPVVSEIVATEHVAMMRDYVDAFQIGTRNMQNFELLKKVGGIGKPVILKRGLSATIQEWLMAAEYLLAHGTEEVILCERGIRTFETYTRNTLDLSAIPVVKKLSHLPIIVDPSHATGIREKVPPMALAAVAAGADGLIVEVHPTPDQALSDGPQSLYPDQFEKLMRDIEVLSPVLGKEVARIPQSMIEFVGVPGPVTGGAENKVAFQGERGAFSEMSIYRFFNQPDIIPVPRQSFRDVFIEVLTQKARYGSIPIENSLSGSIHENYDLLLQYPDIKIVGEQKIRIVHNLIGLPEARFEDITRVFSHPQGFAQCLKFLDDFPHWEKVPFYDTAGAVAYVAEQGRKEYAGIASEEAAKFYRMKVLKAGIETNPQNYTRFVVLAREEHQPIEKPNKASLVFSTPDKPGALYLTLKCLAEHQLNMKKLESRPIPGKPWEYMFYVDVELPEDPTPFSKAVEAMRVNTDNLRLLGLYRA